MLEFNITGQVIKRLDKTVIATDTQKYLKAKFTFCERWAETEKFAIFRNGNIEKKSALDENNECFVPWEVLAKNDCGINCFKDVLNLFISVYAVVDDKRITTNEITVELKKSGYAETEEGRTPTPDLYEVLKEKYNIVATATNDGLMRKEDKAKLDSMKIGTRNYFRWTKDLPIKSGSEATSGISPIQSIYRNNLSQTDNGFKLTFSSDNNGGIGFIVYFAYDGCLENGEELTLSFDYKGNITSLGTSAVIQITPPSIPIYYNGRTLVANENEWQHFSTVLTSEQTANINNGVCRGITMFQNLQKYDETNWIEIKKESLQLTKSNVDCDWNVAIEDVYFEIEKNKQALISLGVDM